MGSLNASYKEAIAERKRVRLFQNKFCEFFDLISDMVSA